MRNKNEGEPCRIADIFHWHVYRSLCWIAQIYGEFSRIKKKNLSFPISSPTLEDKLAFYVECRYSVLQKFYSHSYKCLLLRYLECRSLFCVFSFRDNKYFVWNKNSIKSQCSIFNSRQNSGSWGACIWKFITKNSHSSITPSSCLQVFTLISAGNTIWQSSANT